jgi:hypothetical protein
MERYAMPGKLTGVVSMSTDLTHLGIDCGAVLVALVVLTLVLKRLGFHTWLWWASRQKSRIQDSSAKGYWNAHE